MIASVFAELRRPWAALCVGLLTSVAAQAASAADCPGHPDAIGTSRTIVVDPRAHPIIGTMQFIFDLMWNQSRSKFLAEMGQQEAEL